MTDIDSGIASDSVAADTLGVDTSSAQDTVSGDTLNSDTGSAVDSESDSVAVSDSDSATNMGTGSLQSSDSDEVQELDTGSAIDSHSDVATDSDTGSASDGNTDTGAGTDSDTDTDTDTTSIDSDAGGDTDGDTETASTSDEETPTDDIAWGEAENPTAGVCTVGELPAYSELSPSSELPDPFLMLDGTRITQKSEWSCRREEIRHQMHEYIYGEKPVPSAGSVTGTVSTDAIFVEVNDGTAQCSFSVEVNMNGATLPAPAIIRYGYVNGYGDLIFTGVSSPLGVAEIQFVTQETPGPTGDKSGPFFNCYGGNHSAGYFAAHAWQVSRILDVLEQNPDVIDPPAAPEVPDALDADGDLRDRDQGHRPDRSLREGRQDRTVRRCRRREDRDHHYASRIFAGSCGQNCRC